VRFCNRCRKLTAGKPLFCSFCGATYNVKLCSRLHPNPRYAEVCAQCGTREMTAPHPRIPLLFRPLVFMLERAPKLLLVSIVIGAGGLTAHWLLTDAVGRQFLICLLLVIAFVWLSWQLLPPVMQRLLRSAFRLLARIVSLFLRPGGRKA
jgi:hypothetical protein